MSCVGWISHSCLFLLVSSFHKSCLREWLVQQQTCPTCRGDISQMEARQKQQQAFDARMEENEPEGETQEELDHAESDQAENEALQEDENDPDPDESAEETPIEEKKEEVSSPTPPELKSSLDLKPPPLVFEQPSTLLPIATSVQTESFPAFYRVASNVGASVYRHEDDATAYLVTRVVPCGVVLLGTDREERTCILQRKSMIRMPDGWVNEDDVTRIAAVSLDSLQPQ